MLISFFVLITAASPRADMLADMATVANSEASSERSFLVEGHPTENDSGLNAFVSARRSADGADLWIRLLKLADDTKASRFWRFTVSSSPDATTAFTNLPIGSEMRRHAGRGSASKDAFDGTFFVFVQITYRGSGTRGNVQWQTVDREGDKVACEGLARRCLARLRNLEAQSAGNVQVGTTSVPSAMGPRGDRLVQLTTYCTARGVTLSVNARQGTASFSAHGVQVIVPLAAKRIKAGSEWYDSNDISIIRNAHWFVPLTAIENAYRGLFRMHGAVLSGATLKL